MNPALIPVILQAGAGAAQLIGGSGSLFGNKRPEYEIPDALKQTLALAKIRASDPYAPGYSQAKSNVDLSTANLINAAPNKQESLGMIAGAQNAAYRDLAEMNAQSQYQDEMNLQQALGDYAKAEDLAFQMNEFGPYADRAQEGRNVVGAGLENLFTAADQYAMIGEDGKPKAKQTNQPLNWGLIIKALQMTGGV